MFRIFYFIEYFILVYFVSYPTKQKYNKSGLIIQTNILLVEKKYMTWQRNKLRILHSLYAIISLTTQFTKAQCFLISTAIPLNTSISPIRYIDILKLVKKWVWSNWWETCSSEMELVRRATSDWKRPLFSFRSLK